MARRLPEEFKGKELSPFAFATNLDEAQEIESALNGSNMDYTFEITPVTQTSVFSVLFGAVKEGVMFLAPAENNKSCKTILTNAGLSRLIIE